MKPLLWDVKKIYECTVNIVCCIEIAVSPMKIVKIVCCSVKEEEEQERVNQEKAAEEAGEDRDGQDNQGVWKSVRPQPVAPVAPKPGRHHIFLTWFIYNLII